MKELKHNKLPSLELVEDGLVTVAEAAGFLGVSKSMVYLLMERGELPYAKFGRARRVPRRGLVAIASRSVRPQSLHCANLTGSKPR